MDVIAPLGCSAKITRPSSIPGMRRPSYFCGTALPLFFGKIDDGLADVGFFYFTRIIVMHLLDVDPTPIE